jgi:regulator of nucleoside diphosphate kinase
LSAAENGLIGDPDWSRGGIGRQSSVMLRPLMTELNWQGLDRMLRSMPALARPLTDRLGQKLKDARVVGPTEIPPTVVTMGSRVVSWEMETGAERELTLVYPWEAGAARGRVSVTSELGAQLLAAVPGSALYDRDRVWRILFLAYQPESGADGTLPAPR